MPATSVAFSKWPGSFPASYIGVCISVQCQNICYGTNRALAVADVGWGSPSTRMFRSLEGLWHWFQFSNFLAEVLQLRGGTDSSYIAGDGVATSMILSASWAKLSRLPVSGVKTRTICMFGSKRCEKGHIGKHCLYPGLCLPIAVAFISKTVMVSYLPAPQHGIVVVSVSVPR